MGVDTLIASRGKHSLISEVSSGLHIDPDDSETALQDILRQADLTPFDGILGSDDSTVELAAMAAQALGLPHNPPKAARLSRRKDLARAHLALADCPVPMHSLVDLQKPLERQAQGMPWPCVIKPLNLSASRGVIRVDNLDEFIAACERIRPILAEQTDPFLQSNLLVEHYVDGVEVAYEGFLHEGRLTTLTLFDKPDPLTGPFFEETIYVTPSQLDAETQARIEHNVARACKAYGLTTGPVHAELRVDEQDAWILEVASRTIGGDCARILDQGSDFNLEELVISLAIGQPLANRPSQKARGVMMLPIRKGGILRRVEGIEAARKVRYIDRVDIIIRDGNELVPLPEGNQYPGYLFASGNSTDEVTRALREACDKLNFVVAPLLRIEGGPTDL
ncbi:ATP-grasp domain-containing protein [Thiogranum longum]|uniref:ATP-grasp domain-containing protein n=2 Tax=Thiogranum longum TaxID=1537524 RepID=A0A4R1HC06_9GAMM|nr:ATP-grasp domain-containing protein [Thiogranum longum]